MNPSQEYALVTITLIYYFTQRWPLVSLPPWRTVPLQAAAAAARQCFEMYNEMAIDFINTFWNSGSID
jgi:hypothetical protein